MLIAILIVLLLILFVLAPWVFAWAAGVFVWLVAIFGVPLLIVIGAAVVGGVAYGIWKGVSASRSMTGELAYSERALSDRKSCQHCGCEIPMNEHHCRHCGKLTK